MQSNNENEAQPIKISCKNLWKIFGDVTKKACDDALSTDQTRENLKNHKAIIAVESVDLEIREGEVFSIMGLSGSGKSTLMRCLSRLIEPTKGSLFVEGVDLMAMSGKELRNLRRQKISMVFQNFALLPHRTVLGNVELPLEIQGVPKDQRRTEALQMIELVGLKGRESYYPHELSGGQQQRIGIARSLSTNPEIWFLDEPFSALDPLIRREMQDELLRLQASLKKTIIFVTHDFDEAVKISSRIAVMKDGRIEQCGSAKEILLNPINDYVREFVSDVDWARIITAGDIAETADDKAVDLPKISATTSLRDAARAVNPTESRWAVTNKEDQIVGAITAAGLSLALSNAAAQIPPQILQNKF